MGTQYSFLFGRLHLYLSSKKGETRHQVKTMTFVPSFFFYFIGKKVRLTIKPTGEFSFHHDEN